MATSRQHTTRAAGRTTRLAVLNPALAVLLAVLVMGFGYVTHGHGDPTATAMTTMSAPTLPMDTSDGHHTTAATHPADCPSGDVCCGSAAEGVRAVLATPTQPLPAVLPRAPGLPRPPDTFSRATPSPPTGRAPDLYVLQVQRT